MFYALVFLLFLLDKVIFIIIIISCQKLYCVCFFCICVFVVVVLGQWTFLIHKFYMLFLGVLNYIFLVVVAWCGVVCSVVWCGVVKYVRVNRFSFLVVVFLRFLLSFLRFYLQCIYLYIFWYRYTYTHIYTCWSSVCTHSRTVEWAIKQLLVITYHHNVKISFTDFIMIVKIWNVCFEPVGDLNYTSPQRFKKIL